MRLWCLITSIGLGFPCCCSVLKSVFLDAKEMTSSFLLQDLNDKTSAQSSQVYPAYRTEAVSLCEKENHFPVLYNDHMMICPQVFFIRIETRNKYFEESHHIYKLPP